MKTIHQKAAVALIAWVLLFTAGILVDTNPHRVLIGYGSSTASASALTETEVPSDDNVAPIEDPTFWNYIWAWLVCLTAYSVPNLLLLCIVSSVVGHASRKIQKQGPVSQNGPRMTFFGAALTGFLLYLAFMAGLVTVASTDEFINPQQGVYLRRAPLLSLISFMLAYEPRLLSLFVSRLTEFVESTVRPESEKTEEAENGETDSK